MSDVITKVMGLSATAAAHSSTASRRYPILFTIKLHCLSAILRDGGVFSRGRLLRLHQLQDHLIGQAGDDRSAQQLPVVKGDDALSDADLILAGG